MKAIVQIVSEGKKYHILFKPIHNLLREEPYYHMWYLYMSIGIYLIVPVVIRIKQDVGEKTFKRLTAIYLPIACLSEWTSVHFFNWNIGSAFCYLGYFMFGYVIRKNVDDRKNNIKGICMMLLGISIMIVVFEVKKYQYAMGRLSEN